MNAVEIEEAASRLTDEAFDPEAFPLAFLEASGNKLTSSFIVLHQYLTTWPLRFDRSTT